MSMLHHSAPLSSPGRCLFTAMMRSRLALQPRPFFKVLIQSFIVDFSGREGWVVIPFWNVFFSPLKNIWGSTRRPWVLQRKVIFYSMLLVYLCVKADRAVSLSKWKTLHLYFYFLRLAIINQFTLSTLVPFTISLSITETPCWWESKGKKNKDKQWSIKVQYHYTNFAGVTLYNWDVWGSSPLRCSWWHLSCRWRGTIITVCVWRLENGSDKITYS